MSTLPFCTTRNSESEIPPALKATRSEVGFCSVVSMLWSETTNITVRSHRPCSFWLATKRWSCWSASPMACS